MVKKSIITREISWLSFNARVLQEANDPKLPLKERIRFLGIYSNNRDEFFRVRVATLKKTMRVMDKKKSPTPQQILDRINLIVSRQQDEFNRIWYNIIEELKQERIVFVNGNELTAKQKTFVENLFDREISSSVIPLFVENMSELPVFGDKYIFLGVVLKKEIGNFDQKIAIIEIPTRNHGRFIFLPSAPGQQKIMLLEDLIRFNLSKLFFHLGYTYFDAHMFKVTRDAEIDIDNDLSTTLIQKIENGVKNRRKAPAIRFVYDKTMNSGLLEFLIRRLNLTHKDSIIPGGPIRNFRDFMDFPAKLPTSTRPRPFKHPTLAKSVRVSDVIMRQDILLHLPYHSFNSVIDLLREAAMDPDVTTIQMTAYRLATNSKICNALINAARNGKNVHIILELRAYFDEEANLEWKKKFEEEGVKVFVGAPQMKVHAKICLIKKQVGDRIDYYGFVGTGNLNEKTALIYTDHFLLTSQPAVVNDLQQIFQALENPESDWWRLGLCKTLLVAPLNMRDVLSMMINREIKAAKEGKRAEIILHLNSLSDEQLIKKLHKAATAGVKIQAVIRGIFCVDVAKQKYAKPIRAISIVDEYLEHSRVWLFHNQGNEEIYISSADWMERNFDYRLEVAVPIKDRTIKEELKHILHLKLSDNVKARLLEDGFSNQYVPQTGKKKIRSQLAIYRYLKNKT